MPIPKRALTIAGIYLLAMIGGYVFFRLGVPLPWMIGPLVVTALLYFPDRIAVRIPVETRPFGQGVVASQVGLSFTPVVFGFLLQLAPLLVGMAFLLILIGLGIALVQSRIAGVRLSAAVIATLPMSPVEASVIAERHGFAMAPIILSQTLRISAVVVLIPVAIYAIDGRPEGAGLTLVPVSDPLGTLTLMAVSAAGMLAFQKLRVPNPYFLGPLAVSSAVTAAGFNLPDYPSAILWLAQIVLGTWLGSNFRRSLFTSAGRLVVASITSTLLFILASAMISATLSRALTLSWETLVLASTPGGVTEMALTAEFLGIDVALITAFHLTRIFIVVPSIPPLISWLHRREKP